MTNYFPRHTIAWKIEEPPAFRRLSLSLFEMALLTGVVLRLFRAVVLTHGPGGSWLWFGGTFAVALAFLCAMVTLHLGNYTLRQWVWRAPAFAAVEALAESLASLALIALGREPMGTARAAYRDWLPMALETATWRPIAVIAFALVLSGVVQLVRYALLERAGRAHTAVAVHEEVARQTAEQERP